MSTRTAKTIFTAIITFAVLALVVSGQPLMAAGACGNFLFLGDDE